MTAAHVRTYGNTKSSFFPPVTLPPHFVCTPLPSSSCPAPLESARPPLLLCGQSHTHCPGVQLNASQIHKSAKLYDTKGRCQQRCHHCHLVGKLEQDKSECTSSPQHEPFQSCWTAELWLPWSPPGTRQEGWSSNEREGDKQRCWGLLSGRRARGLLLAWEAPGSKRRDSDWGPPEQRLSPRGHTDGPGLQPVAMRVTVRLGPQS